MWESEQNDFITQDKFLTIQKHKHNTRALLAFYQVSVLYYTQFKRNKIKSNRKYFLKFLLDVSFILRK